MQNQCVHIDLAAQLHKQWLEAADYSQWVEVESATLHALTVLRYRQGTENNRTPCFVRQEGKDLVPVAVTSCGNLRCLGDCNLASGEVCHHVESVKKTLKDDLAMVSSGKHDHQPGIEPRLFTSYSRTVRPRVWRGMLRPVLTNLAADRQ